MSNKFSEDIYDITKYSDEELYNLLDLNNPTDRELEAKIIFMIKKYNNMQNIAGDKLANFFTDIYNYFFDNQDDYDETIKNNETTNIDENINNNKNTDNDETISKNNYKNFFNTIEGFDNNIVPPSKSSIITVTNGLTDNDANKITTDQSSTNIGFVKSLDYAPDQLNPLLNQTIKRIISVDSQYRDDKTSLSTEFTFNLSTPLKDVVSLKLYSIQIPYTWYTINKSYGSNFFYLKGNTPGILNNPNQYMYFDILPGNYSPQELITAINNSITSKSKTIYTDVSFGNTNISYNSNTSLATFNIDIKKQYNQNSYYLKFENFSTPNINDSSRNISIPSFLGFNSQTYFLNNLNSSIFPFYDINNISQDDNTPLFTLTTNNNYFTIVKYIGNINPITNEIDNYNSNTSIVDILFNITLSLIPSTSTQIQKYSRLDIFNDLSNQIFNSTKLSKESYIQRINITDSTNINFSKSIYQLKIKPNRYTTQNLSNSKILIKFYDDPSVTPIWNGNNSCFKFDNSINELSNIISETPSIKQTVTYPITGTPAINLKCITKGFISSLNDSQILLEPSPIKSPYTVDEYVNAINRGIINATRLNYFVGGPTNSYIYKYNTNSLPQYSYSFVDNYDNFNLLLKINKKFDNSMYRLDFTDSYLYNQLNIGNSYNNTVPITNNDTTKITGYISNNQLNILSGTMPQVDLSQVQINISFTDSSNGNIFGTSTNGPIYLSKNDQNYSNSIINNNINNNWIINNNYFKYNVTETTYNIDTNIVTIADKKIDISLNTINVSSNSFNVNNSIIDYIGNNFIIPYDVSNIYFDNSNYVINGNNLSINANSWNIISSNFTIDDNSYWNINGNIVIANDTSWNITNSNFTVSNNNTFNDKIELSGNSLQINYNSINSNNITNTHSFDIIKTNNINSIINVKYNNLWNLNVNDISLNNNIYRAKTNNISINISNNNPLIINNSTGTYNIPYNTLNIYGISIIIGNGLQIKSNSNNNDITFNASLNEKNISILCNSIKIYNKDITSNVKTEIIGNSIIYNNNTYNLNNLSTLESNSIINFDSNNDNINIKITIDPSPTSISNINILGNINISSINNNSFLTNFSETNYPINNLLYSSNSFYLTNNDINNLLTISGIQIDASYNNWIVNGNSLSILQNNNWNIKGKNIFVNDTSFQIFGSNSTIIMPSTNVLVKNGLSINGNSFNIKSNNFYTDSSSIIVNSKTRIDTSSNINFNIYSDHYIPPPNTISINNNINNISYNITNKSSGFSTNTNTNLTLPNTNITSLSGNLFFVNKDNSGCNISAQQLSVSADILNFSNTLSLVGKTYDVIISPISLSSIDIPHDFSINVIYNKSYSSLTNLISTFTLLPQYTIKNNEKIVTIYPRFPNTIQVFGNENDISYNIINNTGKDLVSTSINQLEQNINLLFNSFLDNNNENIFADSKITLSYLNITINQNTQTYINSNLNISINKQLKNKDYSINFFDNNNSWRKNLFVDISGDYGLTNTQYNYPYIINDNISNIVLIKGYKPIDTFVIDFVDNVNNILTFVAYEDGTVSNDIQIKVPITNNGTKIIYSRNVLINTLNNLISQTIANGSYFSTIIKNDSTYTQFTSNINLIYTSKNYNIVFYDTVSFVECYVGSKTVKNTTWDTTVGWILGFRNNSEYNLSDYLKSDNTSQITGDTGVSTNLFNYFLLCIDDYTQNHINDGLITITSTDKNIPLPSYANRNNFTCDPTTRELTYNNLTTTNYSKLTQNQIYSITQVANSQNTSSSNLTKGVSSKNFGVGPFVQDIFGIVPMKVAGLQPGSSYIEFGGTLQNQERIYFGPVNIHRMSIKLVTDRGDIVDLNNVNWSFSLLCEQLYKQKSSKK